MLFLFLLATLALWAIVGTTVAVRRDGYGPRPTDWSRIAGREDEDE